MKYKVIWEHNGNWKEELDNKGTFDTFEKAEKHEAYIKALADKPLTTRIVTVRN